MYFRLRLRLHPSAAAKKRAIRRRSQAATPAPTTRCTKTLDENNKSIVCDRPTHFDANHRNLAEGVRWSGSSSCPARFELDLRTIPCQLVAHANGRHVNIVEGVRWSTS